MQITGGENRMEKYYYRVCTSLNDKGVLIPEGSNLDKYKKGEAYISAFKYNEKHKDLFKKTGSVAGITDVVTDILYFDLDNKDLEVSRKDTITVVERLESYGISSDQLRIDFSGSKGLHIAVHTTDSFSPQEARSLATKVAGDLPSFDSSIYNANRIMRIEGSIHAKTNLRKTPLSFDELKTLTIDDIKALSTEEYEYTKPPKVKLPEAILKLKNGASASPVAQVESDLGSVDYFSNPLGLSPILLAMSQGFFPNGQRSNALIRLASNLRSKGLTDTQCYFMLKAAADSQSRKYHSEKFSKEEIYNNIIKQVYGDNWNGGTFTEDNYPTQLLDYYDSLGVPRKAFSEVSGYIVKIKDKFDEFANYAQDIDKYTMRFGIPSLDKALKARKGHLIGLLAGPGIGKTSFGITLLNNTSKEGAKSLFFSLDMFSLNVYQKLIQRHTGYTEDEMFQFFKDKNASKIQEFKQVLETNYENVSFCFKSSMDVKELKKAIKLEEEKLGRQLDLILVDYLELIETEKSDPTASSSEAINGLREIANDGRVVVVLLQPNKMSSKPDQPMLSYNAAKGSSMIAQAVTAMITCHRPGYSSENPENDRFFSVNIVKNRNGPLSQIDFSWEGKTQTIKELTPEQRFELSVLRDTKKDADEDDY
jgi:KaiC/GvpD/RAD55 family RecA-like ATPase